MRNNVLAWNRDAQVWGWFDIADERHWPKSTQAIPLVATPQGVSSNAGTGTPQTALSLEDLNLKFENNLYCPALGQGLFNWGTAWKKHQYYETLETVQNELSLDQNSQVAEFHVEDFAALDLRIPADSPAITMGCYAHGPVPGVLLGVLP